MIDKFRAKLRIGFLDNNHNIVICMLLSAIAIIPFVEMLLNQGTISFGDDLASFFPFNQFAKNSLHNLQFPFWNPYSALGMPFQADIQTMVFYPLNQIYYLFDYDKAIIIFTALHFFLMALFSYMLLRKLSVSSMAALIGALLYVLNISKGQFTVGLTVFAWLPLVLLLCEHIITSKKYVYFIPLSFITAIQAIGWSEGTFYSAFIVFIYMAIRLVASKEVNLEKIKILGLFVLANIGSLLIAAIQFLPTVELIRSSVRWGSELNFVEAASESLLPLSALSLVFPNLFINSVSDIVNASLQHIYAGIFVIFFSVFAAFYKNNKATPFLAISIFTLAYSLGKNFIVYPIFFNLPVFSKFLGPAKLLMFFTFFISMLAAIGVDEFLKRGTKKVSETNIAVLISILAFFMIQSIINIASIENNINIFEIFKPLLLLAGFLVFYQLATLLSNDRSISREKSTIVLLVLFAVFDFFLIAKGGAYSNFAQKDIYDITPASVEFLKEDKEVYRIMAVGNRLNAGNWSLPKNISYQAFNDQASFNLGKLQSSLPMLYELQEVGAYNPVILKNPMELIIAGAFKTTEFAIPAGIHQIPVPEYDPLLAKLLNVKYIVSDNQVNHPNLKLVFTGGSYIYENSDFLPRAYIAVNAVYSQEKQSTFSALLNSEFKPGKDVIISDSEPQVLKDPATKHKVTIAEYSPNEVVLDVESDGEGFLVLSDAYYSAWKATVNSKEAEILRANHALRAVRIEQGRSQVKFYYESGMFKAGAVISAVTIILMALGAVVLVRHNSSKRKLWRIID